MSDVPDPAPAAPSTPPGLSRPREGRLVGGVAAGLARRFQISPTVVRVAFVVGTLLWGAGAIAYLALWVLLPRDDGVAHPERSRLAGVAVVVITVATVVLVARRGAVPVGRAILAVVIVSVVLALYDTVRARRSGWRLLRGALVTVLSAALAASVLALAVGPVSGVGLHGGVGVRVWRPVVLGRTASTGLLVGSLTVDLRHTRLPGSLDLHVNVDVGRIVVWVPPRDRLVVDATSGIARVLTPPPVSPHATAGAATIVVHVGIGVGQAEVVR